MIHYSPITVSVEECDDSWRRLARGIVCQALKDTKKRPKYGETVPVALTRAKEAREWLLSEAGAEHMIFADIDPAGIVAWVKAGCVMPQHYPCEQCRKATYNDRRGNCAECGCEREAAMA